ncbi:MAG: hypothetical protein EA401_13520 [Planctomycetota bacterium]|nr:MAG: hypothetical protein EA401_13520 [Planctomycetota bacterium]
MLLALLMTCGPQGLLQGIAWSGMLVSYSLQEGLEQGWRDTFSGERPCDLCVALQATDQEPSAAITAREDLRPHMPHYALRASIAPVLPPAPQVHIATSPDPGRWFPWQPQPAAPVPISVASAVG